MTKTLSLMQWLNGNQLYTSVNKSTIFGEYFRVDKIFKEPILRIKLRREMVFHFLRDCGASSAGGTRLAKLTALDKIEFYKLLFYCCHDASVIVHF